MLCKMGPNKGPEAQATGRPVERMVVMIEMPSAAAVVVDVDNDGIDVRIVDRRNGCRVRMVKNIGACLAKSSHMLPGRRRNAGDATGTMLAMHVKMLAERSGTHCDGIAASTRLPQARSPFEDARRQSPEADGAALEFWAALKSHPGRGPVAKVMWR